MTITLPLQPQEEARLIAAANARGVSAAELVREALEGILAESSTMNSRKEPTHSLRGLLAKYGPAPSADDRCDRRYSCRALDVRQRRIKLPDLPDRVIAATAQVRGVPVLSRDGRIRASSIQTIW